MRIIRSRFALPTLAMVAGAALFAGLMSVTPVQAADAKVERAWRANCGSCHGKDGKGQTEQGKKMAVGDMTTADWQKKFTDADMKKSIADGFKREEGGVTKEMKPFKGKLKPEEIDALIVMVRGFAKAK